MASPLLRQHGNGVSVKEGDSVKSADSPAYATAEALHLVYGALLQSRRIANSTKGANLHAIAAAIALLNVDGSHIFRLKEWPLSTLHHPETQTIPGGAVADCGDKGGMISPHTMN